MSKCIYASYCGGNTWYCPFVECKRACPLSQPKKVNKVTKILRLKEVVQHVDINRAKKVYKKMVAKGATIDVIAVALNVPLPWLVDAVNKRKIM